MMLSRRNIVLATFAFPLAASGFERPDKTINLIIPFAAGGLTDVVARLVGEHLASRQQKSVVIESHPGAGGSIALQHVSRLSANGTNLVVATAGAMVINPHTASALANFDPLAQLTPISKVADVPMVLIANPAAKIRNLAELIELSKASGPIPFGTSGVNSTPHFAMEVLSRETGSNLTHVPYRGGALAVTDVLSGQILIACVDLSGCLNHIRSGTLTALGVTSSKRSALVPEVGTFQEQTGKDIAFSGWIGICGPTGMTQKIVAQIDTAVKEACDTQSFNAKMEQLGCDVEYMSNSAFKEQIIRESSYIKDLIAARKSADSH